jgi:hypothetical protein
MIERFLIALGDLDDKLSEKVRLRLMYTCLAIMAALFFRLWWVS